ncbi:MAG: hypothetical protein WCQ69_04470, partial [Bacteroidales bacterium]|jgi:hypothetical protein|nr:hypothetical protein [Bacteroidales bacterium]MDD2264196.1 hypothetical protein [Bacteroidales bacterium]MDD2831332.1 hypothetical protein [Bacteroidales bacterium]MDD3208327.1 hypothetical protein [Bacteroidales bacterium]MDD3696990.1 hypothetical protein [Bacteroidales bacterium]
MNSDTLVTILLSVLAIVFGIINARSKKKKAVTRFPRPPGGQHGPVPAPRPHNPYPAPVILHEEIPEEEIPEEAPPATIRQVKPSEGKKAEKKIAVTQSGQKYGFNAKQAVLFSEILKPKFDEFG